MGYNFPMPFFKMPCGLIGFVSLFVAIWFGFPEELRTQPVFRKRLKSYILYIATVFTIPYQEVLLDLIFYFLKDNEGLWILAFIIPIFRGFYEWVLPKLNNRAAGRENVAATFYMETYIGCVYFIYVTVGVASADEFTAYLILGVEMCINFSYTLQIIFIHNKVQGYITAEEITKWKNTKKSMLRNLVTMEAIEILIPIAYSMCFATAYYGPNARIMAGVKNTYFGFEEVDIKDRMTGVLKIAGIDACGAIFIGLLLGKLCQINILSEFCVIMKKHWITLTLLMGGCIFHVRNIISYTKQQLLYIRKLFYNNTSASMMKIVIFIVSYSNCGHYSEQ
jgi:hypothetical protein